MHLYAMYAYVCMCTYALCLQQEMEMLNYFVFYRVKNIYSERNIHLLGVVIIFKNLIEI